MSDDSCRDLASPGPLVARNTFKIISRVLGLSYCFCLSVKWMRSVCSKCKYSGSAVRDSYTCIQHYTDCWTMAAGAQPCMMYKILFMLFNFYPFYASEYSVWVLFYTRRKLQHHCPLRLAHYRNGNMFPLQGRGALYVFKSVFHIIINSPLQRYI